MNELLVDCLGDKVMARIWERMVSIYGHKWSSHLGVAVDAQGVLTDAAKMWQKGLVGLTRDNLKAGFDALILQTHAWPPSLPEFRKLCLMRSGVTAPTLDEVVRVLTMANSRQGSLAVRYQHPLILAVSVQIDMFAMRTAKAVDARRLVKATYDDLLQTGWEDWPINAHLEPENHKAIGHDKPRNKSVGLSAFSDIKAVL